VEEEIYRQSKSKLRDYETVVDHSVIEELRLLGDRLSGRIIQHINSTYTGGGVAEILEHLVPLLNQLGVDARWNIIRGDDQFFEVTKKFHNALHGKDEKLVADDFTLFLETTEHNLSELKFDGDIFFIHDPQPVALISKKKEIGRRWVWRCHIDVSRPDPQVWGFIQGFVNDYDAAIFSAPNFAQQLPIRQFLIPPAIDPLSDKNKELSPETINSVLAKYGLSRDKPMIVQISRFDYLKDPLGVITAFEAVMRYIDCQLVLAGGTASDDPESEKVLNEVMARASGNPDIHILMLPPGSDLEINALQRAATVVLQKSLSEGFALTISEALWKGKPVVATAVGGIPLQVKHKLTGLLCYSIDGAAYALRQLLTNPEYANWLGQNGRQHVKQNFLVTRQLRDYLLLCLSLDHHEDVIYL
jgi:trehalose synthase